MLRREDYLYFADRALAGMAALVDELGDARANTAPYHGANTPYALMFHCLAVVETWAGGFVRGLPVHRDRTAEFTATGPVAPLVERCGTVRRGLHDWVAAARPDDELLAQPPASYEGPERRMNQGAALQHVFEELAQHHGQMQILRDLLVPAGRTAAVSG